MMLWVFAIIIVVTSCSAALARGMRTAALSLLVCGLAVGGLYVTLGAELLAVLQWIVSTIVVISLVFFGVMFGEYEPSEQKRKSAILIGAVLVGIVFPVIAWLGVEKVPPEVLVLPRVDNDLVGLGKKVSSENFLSLQIVCLTLFVVLIGGGVVARPDLKAREKHKSEEEVEL